MMRMAQVVIGILACVMVAGCQRKAVEAPSAPARVVPTPELKARIARLSPNALLGQVAAVLPESRMVSVADLPAGRLKAGDIVTFMTGDESFAGTGVVVGIVGANVHVRYEEPAPGQPAPEVGDLAIHFPR